MEEPCGDASGGLMTLRVEWLSWADDIVVLPTPICRTGTSVALKRRMMGGVIPGGSVRVLLWDAATSCATPVATSAVGWKKILITATPVNDCDSMCSMSLTVTE